QPPEAAAPPAPPPPAPAAAASPAPAQTAEAPPADHFVTIQRANCQNLLNLSDDDRAAAAMFYIGYQAARAGSRTINVAVIPSIEAQALANCQEHPQQTLVRAFAQAYSSARK